MEELNENLDIEPADTEDHPFYAGEKEEWGKNEGYDVFNPPDERPYP